jgi:hypothetical protein
MTTWYAYGATGVDMNGKRRTIQMKTDPNEKPAQKEERQARNKRKRESRRLRGKK